ncbi:MAG: ATP-binding protein [Bacteroidota bacterium]|nr:ATP-binding protein [Bacteroidota bacterium]MDP4193559.1 ATP-binding protein [Bacteroidota bacterium]
MINKIINFVKTTRFKTTLWYSLLFLVLEIMIGVIIYHYVHTNLNQQLDIALTRQAEAIFHFVTDSKVDLSDFQPDSVYSSPEDLVYDLIYEAVTLNPRNTYVQVEFMNKIIFKTENLGNETLSFLPGDKSRVKLISFKDQKLSTQNIRGAYLNKDNYKIIVAFPNELIHETLNSLKDIYIIIAPIFFIISIIGGSVISAGSLARIDTLIKETDEITAQNLNKKIEGEEFDDEYGRLVRRLNEMIQRIRISIEYMNQFSISASHEMKTPLTILRGELEIALRSPKTAEQYREVLQSNYEETLRLINIVDKLFFISKVDHSLVKLSKTKIQTSTFLENISSGLQILGKDKNMELFLEIKEDSFIEIDAEWMRQAIYNLVENAIKYGYADTPVIISADCLPGRKVKISVKNNGEGIPQQYISKIFDRFYRVESSRNRATGGIGLGLSVVKSIVNWHNGEIYVRSEPEKETEFSIILNQV